MEISINYSKLKDIEAVPTLFFEFHGSEASNQENIKIVEAKKTELAAESEDLKVQAQASADAVSGKEVLIKVAVSEEGSMYGSIGTREIEEACQSSDIQIDKSQVQLPEGPIKEIGEHSVTISFHQEVSTEIIVKVESE